MSPAHLLARWIIRRSARKLPEPDRIEMEVEWLGHLEELPSFHLKLRHAVGIWQYAQISALRFFWNEMTRPKIQEFLLYTFWMVSCWALILDFKVGSAFNEVLPHLLGAIFFCGPALRFVLKPLDEQKSNREKTPDRNDGSA